MKEGKFEIIDYDGEETIEYGGVDYLIHKLNFQARDLKDDTVFCLQANKRVGMQILRLMIEPPPENPWWRRLLRLPRRSAGPLRIEITRCESHRGTGRCYFRSIVLKG